MIQAKGLQRWTYQSPYSESPFHGFTKNETTGQYLLVIRYYQDGDLRKKLQRQATTWEEKIEIIYEIAENMKQIHDAGMIHR